MDQFVSARAEAGAGPPDVARYDGADEFVERLFPAGVFVRLIRIDLDAQAVSFLRAETSGRWGTPAGDPLPAVETVYDFAQLERCRRWIVTNEVGWDRFFRIRGVNPLVITYEQLVADYANTVELVASHVAPGIPITVPPPPMRKLANDDSQAVVERFRAERLARSGTPRRGRKGWHRRRVGIRLAPRSERKTQEPT